MTTAPFLFPDFEVEALQLYANQAAAAYHSSQRMAKLEHLQRAAEALAGAEALPEVLRQIVHSAREVLQADVAAVWPYNPEQERFMIEEVVVDPAGHQFAAGKRALEECSRRGDGSGVGNSASGPHRAKSLPE